MMHGIRNLEFKKVILQFEGERNAIKAQKNSGDTFPLVP
jgi:hypothetical protein